MPETLPVPVAAPKARPMVPVAVRHSPFNSRRVDVTMPEGMTIEAMVEACAFPVELRPLVHVFIEDVEVERRQWRHVRPKDKALVYICVLPHGGGGGKNILRTVATVALVVATVVYAPQLGAAMLSSAGITASAAVATAVGALTINLVGTLVINALIPPPQPPGAGNRGAIGSGSAAQAMSAPSYSITGTSNRTNPYGPIPRIFGRRRVYPVVAANPYTESSGNDQYLRLLLCAGYGPLEISDIRIGETPISEFDGVEMEITEGGPDGWAGNRNITLYTNVIKEDQLSVLLTKSVDWVSRFTDLEANEVTFDVTFPQGLTRYDDKGDRTNRTVTVEAQYRKAGTSSWTSISNISVTDSTSSSVRVSRRITFDARGQYEVRLRRTTDPGDARTVDATYWSALRSVVYKTAVTQTGVALIALRIKASEQLNGTPDQINCIARSYLPTWTPSGGFSWGRTSNPAWAYLDILRRRGNETLVADSRIDLVAIRQWALACAAAAPNGDDNYWEFNGVIEGGSVFEALRLIAGHGRASFTIRDGKYSVVRDVPQTVPVQHITPRNSWGYQGRKQFVDLPHALKVRFVNADKGYVEDERTVYDDGYNAGNATKFETIEFYGCTSSSQAWREGRYHLAVGQLRPEEHSVTMDIESLRCSLGDLVRFSHDVVAIGLGSGRIVQRIFDGAGRVTSLRLDGPVGMEAGKTYGLRIRRMDGTSLTCSLVTAPGLQDIVQIATPIASADAPDEDDLFMYGEATRESAAMVVKRIEPGNDLTAKVSMVDAAPGVWTADTGAIPDFESNITLQGPIGQQAPTAPAFAVRTDETALLRLPDGTLQDRIAVLIAPAGSSVVAVAGYEAQFRQTGSNGWIVASRVTADATEIFLAPAQQGLTYDVRLRAISESGVPSAWTTTTGVEVIGKTTPPSQVKNLTAVRKVDGVQLAWDPNPEIDVVGYTVKYGGSWDSGTLVTERFAGNSLFVALNSAEERTFRVRAVDAIGLLSGTEATYTASVIAPSVVPRFEAFPQSDRVRFTWDEVDGVGNLYEVREGDSWELARLVLRASGSTATVQWPIREVADRTFWVKTISAAGLYSTQSAFTVVAQAPVSSRNVIIERDFAGDGFPGVLHHLTRSPDNQRLVLDKDGSVNRLYGDYFADVDLDLEWYARNWVESRATSATGADVSWASAEFAWDDAGDATWLGVISSIYGIEVTPSIYVDGYEEPDLVEGWELNESTSGLLGTTAAHSAGVNYGNAYFRKGALVEDTTTLDWTRTIPVQFSTTFDLAASDDMAGYSIILRLVGSNGWLNLGYDASLNAFFLEDSAGQRLEVSVPVEDGDVITFGIEQTLVRRSLYAATRDYPTVVADVDLFAPVGTFTTVALHA